MYLCTNTHPHIQGTQTAIAYGCTNAASKFGRVAAGPLSSAGAVCRIDGPSICSQSLGVHRKTGAVSVSLKEKSRNEMKGAWCECRQNYYSLGQISFKALNLGKEIVSLALSHSKLTLASVVIFYYFAGMKCAPATSLKPLTVTNE